MPALNLALDTAGDAFAANRAHMLALIDRCARSRSERAPPAPRQAPLFDKRGQLLPRERVARLLDPGMPFLELSSLAGWLQDSDDPEQSVPGGGMIGGIGYVAGVRVMVVADDSGIDAGAIQARASRSCCARRRSRSRTSCPFVHLVESAGANLLQVPGRAVRSRRRAVLQPGAAVGRRAAGDRGGARLVHGGRRLHARAVRLRDHGARPRARLPRRPAAAEGRDRRGRDRGGARRRGDARRACRAWPSTSPKTTPARSRSRASSSPPSAGSRVPPGPTARRRCTTPKNCSACSAPTRRSRSTCARSSRASSTAPICSSSSPTTARRRSAATPRSAASASASSPTTARSTRPAAPRPRTSSRAAASSASPIVYLQNTTGYIVGNEAERAGMIKHGSKMIQAVSNADGAADHDPVRRLVRRRQLRHVRARLRAALRFQLAERARPR